MTKARVHLWGTAKYASIDIAATEGAVVGTNLRLADGTIVTAEMILNPTPDDGSPEPPIAYWERLEDIPPNVVALAETVTTGIYVITDPAAGVSATRAIEATPDDFEIEHPDGVGGNPTLLWKDADLLAIYTAARDAP